MTTALDLRHQGQADVKAADQAVHREFAPYIEAALERHIASGRHFTVDDIRAEARVLCARDGRDFAPHPNLWGSIIGGARSAGRIVPVGRSNSTRPTRHASRNSVWTATPTTPATHPTGNPPR